MFVRRMVRHAAWGYLALVLLLAPMLGLMHGVVHGAGGAAQAAHAAAMDVGGHGHDHSHGHGHGWLDEFFSTHGDDSDCRMYEQLGHSDVVPPPPALVLAVVLSSVVLHFLEGEILARRAALFEARGPPLAR